jgi:hypothetical protein
MSSFQRVGLTRGPPKTILNVVLSKGWPTARTSKDYFKCRPFKGLAYREDPTILAWETGNELYYPSLDWTLDIGKIRVNFLFWNQACCSSNLYGYFYTEMCSLIHLSIYHKIKQEFRTEINLNEFNPICHCQPTLSSMMWAPNSWSWTAGWSRGVVPIRSSGTNGKMFKFLIVFLLTNCIKYFYIEIDNQSTSWKN